MEKSGGFQSQLLSVMEALAKAAAAEIERRVDDGCALLRLEVSRSRRDIDLLKSRCELMEAELRRSRMRARRRVFYPPAGERFSPPVEAAASRESPGADWAGQVDAGAQDRPPRCATIEPDNEAERIQIKEECAQEEIWKDDPEDKLISGTEQLPRLKASPSAQTEIFAYRHHSAENPAEPAPLVAPADGYNPLPGGTRGAELVVKHEKAEEPDENAAPLDPGRRCAADGGDGRLWSSNPCGVAGDPSLSYAVFEQIPPVFTPQSGLNLVDMVARFHPVGKSHSVAVNAARAKRRGRTFGGKRPQVDEGHSALSQITSVDKGPTPQPLQHLHRDFARPVTNPGRDPTAPSPAATSSLYGHGRLGLGFGLSPVRRLRAPWRPCTGERRFGCTYCDRGFVRLSQLKEHLRSHTGEKPFSCLQCGRSFTKQCNLIRHAVVHSGEKPYECSLCGKCFTQRSSLTSHQKTAH